MYLDMKTIFYDKRDNSKSRRYYDNIDELYKDKGRLEYVGKYIIPEWLGIKNIEITREGL